MICLTISPTDVINKESELMLREKVKLAAGNKIDITLKGHSFGFFYLNHLCHFSSFPWQDDVKINIQC